ncbi:MAG: hypothetical protein ABDK94_09670 [Atribacterota bacterium]
MVQSKGFGIEYGLPAVFGSLRVTWVIFRKIVFRQLCSRIDIVGLDFIRVYV